MCATVCNKDFLMLPLEDVHRLRLGSHRTAGVDASMPRLGAGHVRLLFHCMLTWCRRPWAFFAACTLDLPGWKGARMSLKNCKHIQDAKAGGRFPPT
jgi:hypothetical protein